MVKGGSPPKKRHTRSLPPFARHLKYEPMSGSDVAGKRNCGMTRPPSDGNLLKASFPGNLSLVGPSDNSALNPGRFISHLQIVLKFTRMASPKCGEMPFSLGPKLPATTFDITAGK